ncbi:hypothetical protein YC2023_088529 [Brassica napus]
MASGKAAAEFQLEKEVKRLQEAQVLSESSLRSINDMDFQFTTSFRIQIMLLTKIDKWSLVTFI